MPSVESVTSVGKVAELSQQVARLGFDFGKLVCCQVDAIAADGAGVSSG